MPYLQYDNSEIHYIQFGQGPKLLIAIHGFADIAETFVVLETPLAQQYTVIALDLPLHGQTKWAKDFYTKEDIIQIIRLLSNKHSSKTFALMGHSMGTRLIIKILPQLINEVERLFFLAPDGLRSKYLFNMNLVPVWFRWWAKKRLEKPNSLQRITKYLSDKGLVKPIVHKFVSVHLSNPRRRRRLLGVWISHQYFMTYPWKFAQLLRNAQLPIDLVYGEKDNIIPMKEGKRFVRKVPHAKLHLLESNHKLINEELADLLREIVL